MTVMVRSSVLLTFFVFMNMIWDFALGDSRKPKFCYQCTSGSNDGCEDRTKLNKWATECPIGTLGCLKMKAPGSPLMRSCGNPSDSPVPIKDGCVNKPLVGIICSCSSSDFCNSAVPTKTAPPTVLILHLFLAILGPLIFAHGFRIPFNLT